jgi:general secretion pathway protein F
MLYRLRVLREGLTPYQVELDASSLVDARIKAEQQGLTVLKVNATQAIFGLLSVRQKKHAFPLILFCQEFRVLFEAGLSVMDVLQTLMDKENNIYNQQVLQQLATAVQEGKTLSQAMLLCPNAFSGLFVATIGAAETTGDLTEALLRYSLYLENIDLLKKRVISATVYPAIVVTFGLVVLTFLIVYVIPKFSKIYESQIAHVSTSTQLLLNLGKFSQQYGVYLLIGVSALIVAVVTLLMQVDMRKKLYGTVWKLPFLGDKVRIYSLSRFYRTFSMLLKSGIPVMNGLSMAENLLGEGLQANLRQAKKHISEGQHFSHALFISDLTTPVAMRLFNVGEKTGTLDKMMERAASFHEEQMVRWIDRFTKVFEPVLMALIGLLIGGIVLLMYIPIFELASGIQ